MTDYVGMVVQAAAETVTADTERRTITATLTTYDTITYPQSAYGMPIRLADGALEIPEDTTDVKILQGHNSERIVGVLTSAELDGKRLRGTFRLGRTQDAEDALMNAEDGIVSAVSVGYQILSAAGAVVDGEDVIDVTAARLFEVSFVGHPGDPTARIESVNARKDQTMPDAPATEQTPQIPAAPAPALDMTALAQAVAAQLAPQDAAPLAAPTVVRPDGSPVVMANGLPVAYARQRPGRYPAARGRDGSLVTAGDYFTAYATAVKAGDWEPYNRIQAALADELTSDVPGLLPQQIVGELLGRASGRRTLWDSLTSRDMPMIGEKFSRPKITQHVDVAPQAAQKTQVASRKYTVALEDVTKTTMAGGLDVSQQALDWTSPSLLNELVIDFTRIYVARTDAMAGTNLNAAAVAGAQTVAWDGTAATLTKALADAAAMVFTNAPEEADAFPNTLWMSVDVWARLAGLTDTTGRPLLPSLGPWNAVGTIDLSDPENGINLPGFRTVVSKNLPAGTLIMGDREYTESYENGRRFLQAVRADVLGLDIAYMGYVATYFPYPETLVKITVPPAGGGALAATADAKK